MPDNQSGTGWLSLLRNPAVALPVAATVGGLIVFAVFEIPALIPKAIFAFRQERAATELAEVQARAASAPSITQTTLTPEQVKARTTQLRVGAETGAPDGGRCDPEKAPSLWRTTGVVDRSADQPLPPCVALTPGMH